jgi:signal transduction histidine kinase
MSDSTRCVADRMHDQLQQFLSAARMKAGLIRRQSGDPATIEGLRDLERLLEQALAESTALIEQLKSMPDQHVCAAEPRPHS